jgi:hypothetical protein
MFLSLYRREWFVSLIDKILSIVKISFSEIPVCDNRSILSITLGYELYFFFLV